MQQAKLVFLGTGGDSLVVGKHLRSSGGIVLQIEDNQFHIDPGPGALTRAHDFGINLRNNIGIFVTHNHINHTSDLNAVISAMTHNGFDKTGVVIGSESAILGIEDENMQPALTSFHKQCIEKELVLKPGKRVGINEVEIRAVAAEHNDSTAIGLKFYTSKFVMGYTGDTKYSSGLVEDYKDVDLLILNCVNPKDTKSDYNLNTDDVVKMLSKIKPRLAIITHFGIKMDEATILNETRRIQREAGVQTIAAKDGMAINPLSYSVSLRQKTLKLF